MRASSRRGQVLTVAAFAISILLLSANVYIYRNSRIDASPAYSTLIDYAQHIRLGSIHAVTASLVNVSNGGASSNLGDNIDRWEAFTRGDYRFGICDLNATLGSQVPYSDGIWLDWGVSGGGVSSAYIDFTLEISGRGAEVDWAFPVNRTTEMRVSGSYTVIVGDQKAVTVTMSMLNEGSPALAQSSTLEYWDTGLWNDASLEGDYTAMDYGNGTYRFTFSAEVPGNQINIRMRVNDVRGVFVEAQETLVEG
ncbi:MAG: hypothetical protein NWE88_12210 [Candidatus Bathyarchaeota archaeon]|nr:hypothetical protein [Candidatus Bathyarchaeota archaeon]